MPFQITFDDLPAGYAVKSARHGDEVQAITTEFTSSEDGERFISRLEGMPTDILNRLSPEDQILPHNVYLMLAIIRKDLTATVFLNEELKLNLKVRPKRDFEKGQPVYDDDYASIEELSFEGITIPEDTGFLFINSRGWRKSLLFDLSPLHGEPRTYNLNKVLGHYCAYLHFQYIFQITESQWSTIIGQGWFPFVSLKQQTNKRMIAWAEAGFDIDELTEEIEAEIAPELDRKLKSWASRKSFALHIPFFTEAIQNHREKKYISSTSILYPRIEGLMRSHFASVSTGDKPKVKSMIDSVTDHVQADNPSSLILPAKFKDYLTKVVFAHFDHNDPQGLNRNTVSHGVAPTELYSLKNSLRGILILDQLFFLMQTLPK
jgi:hypothetical protein